MSKTSKQAPGRVGTSASPGTSGTSAPGPGTTDSSPGVSRRRLLGTAGAAGATGLVLGAGGGAAGYAATRPDA
ncbi:deferrochelatase/peroxidase EfeB, partial [Streptomyces sp. WZ.A104]